MGEVRFATKPIDRRKFTEVGTLAKLESKALNNGPSRLGRRWFLRVNPSAA